MQEQSLEIRWHGRGGQGAVTSAELLALAAIGEGKYAQAMPSFGPERRGAPVLAFNRIDTKNPIRTRAAVTEPHIVIILEPGLLEIIDVTSGLRKSGTIVVNSNKNIEELKTYFNGEWTLAAVDAITIAREKLGVPIVNTTMIGALIKASNIISIASLEEPLRERFGAKGKNNLEACNLAYEKTVITKTGSVKAKAGAGTQAEKLLTWKEILPGAVIVNPGNAKHYRTGDWSSAHPKYDYNKCTKCGLCFVYCPEGCIRPLENDYFEANLYYCKGCGICARECPTDAITMTEV